MSSHSDYKTSFVSFDPFSDGQSQVNYVDAPQIEYRTRPNYSDRIGSMISEKYALKIDYNEIYKDLHAFGIRVRHTDPQKYHPNLDIVRLKYSLQAMRIYINEIEDQESSSHFIEEAQNAFEILSRDYHRISDKLQKEWKDKTRHSLDDIEKIFDRHLEYYNIFGFLLQEFMQHKLGDEG